MHQHFQLQLQSGMFSAAQTILVSCSFWADMVLAGYFRVPYYCSDQDSV